MQAYDVLSHQMLFDTLIDTLKTVARVLVWKGTDGSDAHGMGSLTQVGDTD